MRVLNLILLWTCSHLSYVTSQGIAPPPSAKKKDEKKPEGEEEPKDDKKEDRKPDNSSSHYREREERHIEVAAADFYCLDGFLLNSVKHRCERNDEKPSELGCPHGWDYKSGDCQTTEVLPADRFCLDGYQERLGRCQRQMTAPKQLLCPPAYNRTEFGCVKDVQTEPIVQCIEGDLVNGACATLVEVIPVVQCDPGFEHLGDHCARKLVQPPQFLCPPGFKEARDSCVAVERSEPTYSCPFGSSLKDSLCHTRKAVPATAECTQGTLDHLSHMCVTEVEAVPLERCPPGSELLGDMCLKDELAEPEASCPMGAIISPVHGCQMGKDYIPPSKGCPPGFSLKDKHTCHRRVTLHQERICPTGFELDGMRCVATEYAPPRTRCPENAIAIDGQCWEIESFLPEALCPPHLVLDTQNNYCFGEAMAHKTPICQVGTYDEKEDACISAEIAPSIHTCPPGSRMINGVCQERIVSPPHVACPQDFMLHQLPNKPVCLGRALAEGDLGCLEPYVDNGDGCVFTETVPKMLGCVNGGELKGTSCIKPQSQRPVVICDDGYIYNDYTQLCTKKLWAKPVPICPKGFVYDNLVQKCYKLKKKGEQAPAKKPHP